MEEARIRSDSPRWLWVAAVWGGIALFDATQNVFVMRAEGMHHYWARLFFTLFVAWLPWALYGGMLADLILYSHHSHRATRSTQDWHPQMSGSSANGLMFPGPVGKPINLYALAADVVVPLLTTSGVQWHGWHAFRRGLATNLHRLGVPDKIIQRILRHSSVAVPQSCYIKTADSDASAAMQQFGRSLQYATDMHLSGGERKPLM